jgi:hypothetical protein
VTRVSRECREQIFVGLEALARVEAEKQPQRTTTRIGKERQSQKTQNIAGWATRTPNRTTGVETREEGHVVTWECNLAPAAALPGVGRRADVEKGTNRKRVFLKK